MTKPKSGTCVICKKPATKMVLWADARAFQFSCDDHVKDTQDMLVEKNGNMAELAGTRDLAVPSSAFPDLERAPGKADNWVERAGGLPDYIERIAKQLHYTRGMTISHSIATAVNTVKRWARKGSVAKYGSKENVTAKTQAQAIKALAEWEAKRASARASSAVSLSAILVDSTTIDLTESRVDLQALAARANAIEDPEQRAIARGKVLDLANTQSGRRSFKGQGKWKHGFIPVDDAAKRAKAKGSPIALRRVNRLYGGQSKSSKVTVKQGGDSISADSVGLLRGAKFKERRNGPRAPRRFSTKDGSVRNRVAEKPWGDIPDNRKTIRDGKRYVLTEFGGRVRLVEWTGARASTGGGDKANRRYSSVGQSTLKQFTPGELTRLRSVPGQPASVKKAIGTALNQRRSKR